MRIAIACGLVFGTVALLQPAAGAQFAEKKVLTLEIARKIVATAEAEAARNHLAIPMPIITMASELTGLCTRMRRSFARFS